MSSALSTHRIEALGDGVFAIAMTLLILDFHVPQLAGPTVSEALGRYLLTLWPTLVCYVMSFMMLGVFWIGQHNQFHFIKHVDRQFLWINVGYLMCIAFIPFSTALLGRYWREPLAIYLYGGNMVLSSLALYAHWIYAVKTGLAGEVEPAAIRMTGRRILRAVVLYLSGMGISLARPEWCLLLFAINPFLYIMPGKIDRYWRS